MTNKGALWYNELPTTTDYNISGLIVSCTSVDRGSAYAFTNLINLLNCTGTGYSSYNGGKASGFYNCHSLINCIGEAYTDRGSRGSTNAWAFQNCSNLTHCEAHCTGSAYSDGSWTPIGFYGCVQLSNCRFDFNNDMDFTEIPRGFSLCKILSNCVSNVAGYRGGYAYVGCHQCTNCTGTGINLSEDPKQAYSFTNCSYLNGCKQGDQASTTAFLGGTNTKVDTLTVVAS